MFFFQFINLFAGNGGFGHSGGEITIRTTLRTQGCDEVHDINVIRLRPIYFQIQFIFHCGEKSDVNDVINCKVKVLTPSMYQYSVAC